MRIRPHFVIGLASQAVAVYAMVFRFSWWGLGLALVLHFAVSCLGITLAFHRLLSHKAFVLWKPLEYLFATLGSLAYHGDPVQWVTLHRQHHRYSDTDLDPHNARRGLLYSHMLWFADDVFRFVTPEHEARYAPDLLAQPFYRLLRPLVGVVGLLVLVLLYAWGGVDAVLWGAFVRYFLGNHSTFLVNSAAHTFGWRAYPRDDLSTNCSWVALPSFGEGWHNNHHAFPASAQLGFAWYQLDPGWWVILLLERLGLATEVRRPTPEERAAGQGPGNLLELLGLVRPTTNSGSEG